MTTVSLLPYRPCDALTNLVSFKRPAFHFFPDHSPLHNRTCHVRWRRRSEMLTCLPFPAVFAPKQGLFGPSRRSHLLSQFLLLFIYCPPSWSAQRQEQLRAFTRRPPIHSWSRNLHLRRPQGRKLITCPGSTWDLKRRTQGSKRGWTWHECRTQKVVANINLNTIILCKR